MYVTSSLGPTQLVCNIEINNLVGTCITYYIYIYRHDVLNSLVSIATSG